MKSIDDNSNNSGHLTVLRNALRIGFVTLMACGLLACASQVPLTIRQAPGGNPGVTEARQSGDGLVGAEVRWGGAITRVENKAAHTWIEVVSRELQDNGKPMEEGKSAGRFIASFKGFADPVVFREGQLLTVRGIIEDKTTRPIGEYLYTFPVVSVTDFYLWPVEKEFAPHEYPPGWYYDPWPFYPWWPYPPYYW